MRIFYSNVVKAGALLRDPVKKTFTRTKFNMKKYAEFYTNHDVMILRQGFLKFAKYLMDELQINVLDYITISSLSYDYITRHCLEKK